MKKVQDLHKEERVPIFTITNSTSLQTLRHCLFSGWFGQVGLGLRVHHRPNTTTYRQPCSDTQVFGVSALKQGGATSPTTPKHHREG
ncbi:hypothetical protein E2C01_091389 [Portunus trituberculatus]|uniref:Uncharacterized protein n=1 Tax=Portunus trituberculatus TaxID=210409 RepID=A0A5B7JSR9_PORTR|nr:hypothetical protein [Portunus trituberculatus]